MLEIYDIGIYLFDENVGTQLSLSVMYIQNGDGKQHL